jgi:lysyl-tRNA synthetase class 2
MPREYSNLEQIRLEKVERLRAMGIEPYPARAERTHTSREAIEAFEASESAGYVQRGEEPAQSEVLSPERGEGEGPAVRATLAGRLRSIRPMGKITFAHLEDEAGRVQLFFRAGEVGTEGLENFNKFYDLGDFIQASGEMFRTRSGEATLRVEDYRLLAKAITPLPAAKDEVVEGEVVRHATLSEPEVRFRQRYADLAVNPNVRRIFVIRAAVLRALRQFLDGKGFLEVETPILQPIYGGAAARPFITHHNQLKLGACLRDRARFPQRGRRPHA